MSIFSRYFLVHFSVYFLITLCTFTYSHEVLAHGKKRTAIEMGDIKGWQNLGPLWAGGLDEKGHLLAIYDLSYPTLLDRVRLGLFNPSAENYDKTIQLLQSSQSLPLSKKTRAKLLHVIGQLEQLRKDPHNLNIMGTGSVLPSKWWKNIPWNSDLFAMDDQAPRRFFLSDINYRAIVKDKDYATFDQQVNKLGSNILSQFEFVKSDNGSYVIYWSPDKARIESSSDLVTAPVKIVDFQCAKCGLWESLGIDALNKTLTGLLGLIPIPMVAGLLDTALTEYFMLQKELALSHQEMALEMIRTADENASSFSPFAPLSGQDRVSSSSYLLFAESTLLTSLQWIIKKPSDVWVSQESQALQLASDSADYLTAHQVGLSHLNPRFALGTNPSKHQRMYSLAAPRYGILPPMVAIDYEELNRITYERMIVETTHMLVVFLKSFIPVPGVGTIVSQIYELLIESPMHTVQHWESRLSGHLNARIATGENWDGELAILEQQKINPFELPPDEAKQLVEARKKAFGIP